MTSRNANHRRLARLEASQSRALPDSFDQFTTAELEQLRDELIVQVAADEGKSPQTVRAEFYA